MDKTISENVHLLPDRYLDYQRRIIMIFFRLQNTVVVEKYFVREKVVKMSYF